MLGGFSGLSSTTLRALTAPAITGDQSGKGLRPSLLSQFSVKLGPAMPMTSCQRNPGLERRCTAALGAPSMPCLHENARGFTRMFSITRISASSQSSPSTPNGEDSPGRAPRGRAELSLIDLLRARDPIAPSATSTLRLKSLRAAVFHVGRANSSSALTMIDGSLVADGRATADLNSAPRRNGPA